MTYVIADLSSYMISGSKSDMIECSILSELEDKTGWKQDL
jgi:hypothetical protein